MRQFTVLVHRCGRDLVNPATAGKLELQAHALATQLRAIDEVGRQASAMTLACRAAYAIEHPEYRNVAAHDLIAVAAYTFPNLGHEGYTAVEGARVDAPTRRESMLLRFLSLVGREILLDGAAPEAGELRRLRQ